MNEQSQELQKAGTTQLDKDVLTIDGDENERHPLGDPAIV